MNYDIYTTDKLIFIVTPEKVIVRTNLQQFYLLPKAHYFNRRLNMIRNLIIINEIRDLNELASYTGRGIDWVTTSIKYDLDRQQAMA